MRFTSDSESVLSLVYEGDVLFVRSRMERFSSECMCCGSAYKIGVITYFLVMPVRKGLCGLREMVNIGQPMIQGSTWYIG